MCQKYKECKKILDINGNCGSCYGTCAIFTFTGCTQDGHSVTNSSCQSKLYKLQEYKIMYWMYSGTLNTVSRLIQQVFLWRHQFHAKPANIILPERRSMPIMFSIVRHLIKMWWVMPNRLLHPESNFNNWKQWKWIIFNVGLLIKLIHNFKADGGN